MIISGKTRESEVILWNLGRACKVKICTGMKRWQKQSIDKNTLPDITHFIQQQSLRWIVLLTVLSLCLSSSFAIAQSSSWKVGRGAISGSRAGSGLSLKISLRNVGTPASDTVTIMGRWSRSQPGKRSISGSELASFVELGVFTRAFAMKQTVILELELAPLGSKTPQIKAIEIAIVTDNRVTDGAVISTNY
jgi:hypothetical protein